MKAILIGSIGALTETSEIQRQCFNQALAEHKTGLYWNVANYCEMIRTPGGLSRLRNSGIDDKTAKAIHDRKQQLFTNAIQGVITPRDGILDLLAQCHSQNIKTGFVTTTTVTTLSAIKAALSDVIDFDKFDIITTAQDTVRAKPHPDIYHHALAHLGVAASEALVIEDTEANAKAAELANITCLFTPGEYALAPQAAKAPPLSYDNCADIMRNAA